MLNSCQIRAFRMSDWDKLVYPDLKNICFIASSVFIYYFIAIVVLILCWGYANKRLIIFSTVVLAIGFANFGIVQIICYVDYIVDFNRCAVYTRLTTIFGDIQHLTFDLYQMKKILPLLGSVVKKSKPLLILSWAFFAIRIVVFIIKNAMQTVFVAPPIGGFKQPGLGICGNTIKPIALIAIRLGSFSFEFLLFIELLYIIYRLKLDSRSEDEYSRNSAAASIENMLDVELFIFAIYFAADLLILIMLLVPNSGYQYGIFGTIYNAILPTIVMANVICSRFFITRYKLSIGSYPQTQHEWNNYFRSIHQQNQTNSAVRPSSGSPNLSINLEMFKSRPRKEFQYSENFESNI